MIKLKSISSKNTNNLKAFTKVGALIFKGGRYMAVRQISYTVTANGISPTVKQFGGVQGEHKATEVIFEISESLSSKIQKQADENGWKIIYRFDGFDGAGGVINSDVKNWPQQPQKIVSYFLEEPLTRYGGLVRVVLVISALLGTSTEMELYSFPALLQLENSPNSISSENYQSISTLAQVAKDASQTAVEAKEAAVEAQGKTEAARAALEGGVEYIFDGGNASNEIDIQFVLDNQMSDTSDNPVKNRVIKKYVDDSFEQTELKVYPIGSVYVSNNNKNPAEKFGGKWELINKEFKGGKTKEDQSPTEMLKKFQVISIRAGNTIRFRIYLVTKESFSDTKKLLGKVDFSKHGLMVYGDGYFPYGALGVVAMNDYNHSVILLQFHVDGKIETLDSLTGEGKHITPAGAGFWFESVFVLPSNYMNDEYCNRFYWLRKE